MYSSDPLRISMHIIFLVLGSIAYSQSSYDVYKADADPVIDGIANETCWQGAAWKSIDQLWLGTAPSASDFQGKYKICWRGSKLYILAEIVDNVLYDGHVDPLVEWYNDDCLEIFIDEDNSNGNHQCNYNAFAYHVAINGDNVDLGTDCNPHLYNSHITSARTNSGTTYTWEVAMTIYSNTYSDVNANTPVNLYEGKTCGMSLAYCDDDGSNVRESFIGSEVMPAGHNNDNYITADYFGTLLLKGENPTLGISESEINVQTFQNQILLSIQNEIQDYQVSIFDLSGKCLENGKGKGSQFFSANRYEAGCYLILLESEKTYIVKKIIITSGF